MIGRYSISGLNLNFVWTQLERLKSENTATVARLSSHLQSLWDRVDMPQDDRCRFLAENSGISQRVVHLVLSSALIIVSHADVKISVIFTCTVLDM